MPRKIVCRFAVVLGAVWALFGLPGSATAQGPGLKKLPKLLAAKPLDMADESDEIRRLLRARYNAVLEEARGRWHQLQAGTGKLDPLLESFRRLRASGVEVAATGKNRLEFLEDYVDMTRRVEEVAQKLIKQRELAPAEGAQARYLRLDAEIHLLRARRELTGPKGTEGR